MDYYNAEMGISYSLEKWEEIFNNFAEKICTFEEWKSEFLEEMKMEE